EGIVAAWHPRGDEAECAPQHHSEQRCHAAREHDGRYAHGAPSPLKPMNASAIRPAVTSAIGAPLNASGTSEVSRRSRNAANSNSARPKPAPALAPNTS